MKINIECNTWEELVDLAKEIIRKEPIKMVSTVPAVVSMPEVKRDEEPVPLPEPAPESEKTYTLPEVRKFLGDLRKAGKKEAVTSLINSMGYSKFTDVPEEMYAELMSKAEVL